jgi:signal transduction histidine kinase
MSRGTGRSFEPLDRDERLAFERLLQWLRLSFLVSPILVLAAFGAPALPFAVLIGAATLFSFGVVEWLLRRDPRTLLAWQLPLRIADCALVLVVLFYYHAFLRDAYYDSVYLLFVCAGAATHGRRGVAWLAPTAGAAVLICRWGHVALGVYPFQMRHLTDPVYYTIFFAVTGVAVAHLMERSARAAERMRDQALAAASHDLKNPLAVILGTVQLLERRMTTGRFDPERDLERLARINETAARMLGQLEDLVATARAGAPGAAGTGTSRREPTDLVALVRRAAADHAAAAGQRPLRVEVERDSLVGSWDTVGLGRVLDNLLSNAIKYSPDAPDAEITVSLRRQDGAALLRVRDRGRGIPEVDRDRVFERFYRGANAEGTPGSGVGLAAARQVVESLGGTLALTSRDGEGAEFTVTLPLDAPASADVAPTPATAAAAAAAA